ncbi:hypothetical protein O181_011248 [Austropuccinia psidii MF-1]|uniref:Adenylyl cyclase-associated protein n=1 Tax=Austropuccinia psidii MF-1 TaxID=1389203 RepID=A0A9Q3GL46_9BASI|nr:hypothetical protein [Austropuccinia psidii MF-1]
MSKHDACARFKAAKPIMANNIPTQGVGSFLTLIKRLEAATSRLEDIAIAQTSSAQVNVTNESVDGGIPALNEPSENLSPSVKAYDEMVMAPLQSYLSLSKEIGGCAADQAQYVDNAFGAQRNFLLITSSCQKPNSSNILMELLQPISEPLNKAVEIKDANRGDKRLFNGLTVVAEGIAGLGWVVAESKPGPMVAEAKDSAQFWVNRVVKDFKQSDPKLVDWVKSFVNVLEELRKYIMQFHTTCLTWNPKGKEPSVFAKRLSNSAASDRGHLASQAPPPPPPPPPGPPPPGPPPPLPQAASHGGMDAVFSALNQGEQITQGLKKVDPSQMTHKNPNLRLSSNVASQISQEGVKRPTKPPKPSSFQKKPAKTELVGNKWSVEYHEGQSAIILEDTELSHIVNIFGCKNSTIQIKGKVNAITLVSCTKTSVLFDSVVSSLSVTSSHSFTVQVLGKCPTIMVDATDGGQIYLSKESLDVEIITAKTSAINVSLPKGDEEGVFVEKAMPEQMKSIVQDGNILAGHPNRCAAPKSVGLESQNFNRNFQSLLLTIVKSNPGGFLVNTSNDKSHKAFSFRTSFSIATTPQQVLDFHPSYRKFSISLDLFGKAFLPFQAISTMDRQVIGLALQSPIFESSELSWTSDEAPSLSRQSISLKPHSPVELRRNDSFTALDEDELSLHKYDFPIELEESNSSPASTCSYTLVKSDSHDSHELLEFDENNSCHDIDDGSKKKSDQSSLSVLAKLEGFVLEIIKQISGAADPQNHQAGLKTPISVFLKKWDSSISRNCRKLRFPRDSRHPNSGSGARQLAMVLRVVEIAHEAILRNVVVTKRDIFYNDVNLFLHQASVDQLVDDLAATFELTRSDLHISASPKGLFQGDLQLITFNKDVLSGLGPPVLIPSSDIISEVNPGEKVKFILIVEKEAVFNSLVSVNFTKDDRLGNSILICGIGYPSLSTRQLTARLSKDPILLVRQVPIFVLVDYDPHGIDIMKVYKLGSQTLAAYPDLCAPHAEWLGLKASDLDDFAIDRRLLCKMSARDHAKAKKMISREDIPETWKDELDFMCRSGCKAEIQILSSSSISLEPDSNQVHRPFQSDGGLVLYLLKKIKEAIVTNRECAGDLEGQNRTKQ